MELEQEPSKSSDSFASPRSTNVKRKKSAAERIGLKGKRWEGDEMSWDWLDRIANCKLFRVLHKIGMNESFLGFESTIFLHYKDLLESDFKLGKYFGKWQMYRNLNNSQTLSLPCHLK